MDKDRKTLKEYSVVLLVLAGLSLIRLVFDFCTIGFDVLALGVEGVSESLLKTITIIIFAIAIILLIPEVYVGVKGIKEAKNPTGAKAHITWSLILLILTTIGAISSIIDIFNGYATNKMLEILDMVVDASLLYTYYQTAKKVAQQKQ